MKIDEMPAGREMDALVGKHIFDREKRYGCLIDDCCGDGCVVDVADCFIALELSEKGKQYPGDCPQWQEIMPSCFSTNIAAAWEVVEEMKKQGWSFRFSNNAWAKGQNAAAFFRAVKGIGRDILTGDYVYEDNAWAIGDTESLAIARAALKAVGVSEV